MHSSIPQIVFCFFCFLLCLPFYLFRVDIRNPCCSLICIYNLQFVQYPCIFPSHIAFFSHITACHLHFPVFIAFQNAAVKNGQLKEVNRQKQVVSLFSLHAIIKYLAVSLIATYITKKMAGLCSQ